MRKIIIAAVSKNGVIGKEGKVPWRSSEELQLFKTITIGNPVIMGRKTYESIRKPLKDRSNIVISRNIEVNSEHKDIVLVPSLKKAFKYCEHLGVPKVFIIGGGEIYKEAITSADEMLISYMKLETKGDVYFPEISSKDWKEISRVNYKDFEFVEYKRKN